MTFLQHCSNNGSRCCTSLTLSHTLHINFAHFPLLQGNEMVCWQRDAGEAIPGCDGDGELTSDYCTFVPPNYLKDIGNNGGAGFPLGLCEVSFSGWLL